MYLDWIKLQSLKRNSLSIARQLSDMKVLLPLSFFLMAIYLSNSQQQEKEGEVSGEEKVEVGEVEGDVKGGDGVGAGGKGEEGEKREGEKGEGEDGEVEGEEGVEKEGEDGEGEESNDDNDDESATVDASIDIVQQRYVQHESILDCC